jgi:hypothetical protein
VASNPLGVHGRHASSPAPRAGNGHVAHGHVLKGSRITVINLCFDASVRRAVRHPGHFQVIAPGGTGSWAQDAVSPQAASKDAHMKWTLNGYASEPAQPGRVTIMCYYACVPAYRYDTLAPFVPVVM